MKVIDCVCRQGLKSAKEAANKLLALGARVINVDRNMVPGQGGISEEFEIWFEAEEEIDKSSLDPDMEATKKLPRLGGTCA